MTNTIRFYIDSEEVVDTTYTNIPIPQMGSIVMLHDEPLKVKSVTYGYGLMNEGEILIDVEVEHMEDEFFD
ncbi:hypothetical protein [uncultured Oscillibacter sp.]|uniref:hypothetical protein n=1 Tax=uncultured Oscillibacter sp. TaxID=876091 RepID=UPI0025E6D323|nr:hypothetical protein [uncultured Oscillibacter sp.]